MNANEKLEEKIDIRFSKIFSDDAIKQYSELSVDNQRAIRKIFKDMFMNACSDKQGSE